MESTTESHLPNSKLRREKNSNLTLWLTFSKTKYALLKLKKSIKHDLRFGDTTMKLAQKISISPMPASTKLENIFSEEMKKERWMQKAQMRPILSSLGILDLNLKILLTRSQRKSMNMNFLKDKKSLHSLNISLHYKRPQEFSFSSFCLLKEYPFSKKEKESWLLILLAFNIVICFIFTYYLN